MPQRGSRPMKEYPLTDSDLHDLRNTGVGATFFLSVGSVLIGIWSNITTSMAFSSQVPKDLLAIWNDREHWTLFGSVGCYVIGFLLVFMGYTRMEQIKADVVFQDGTNYKPKRWLRVGLGLVVLIVVFVFGYWVRGEYGG